MIKTNIAKEYPLQIATCLCYNQSIYIADYTEQTKHLHSKKSVEVFNSAPPLDIDFFSLQNDNKIKIGTIIFNNTSFTYINGNPRSQCECVVFPESAGVDSWIFFVELKYSYKIVNNNNNLRKAIIQLYKTRTYYLGKGIFTKDNTCYLIASLPMQPEPFSNFALTAQYMQKLKRKHNVILRLKNSVEIIDDTFINV